ncbi:MAG: hypothetical protein QF473_37080 [Planctomycetota bacterium]|jgi:hypothetical protein|nr:hypothetical protein [Planctomycetota bacterium]
MRIEGTIELDGMIEGRLPNDPESESNLESWTDAVAQLGMQFSLEIDGSRFSMLVDEDPFAADRLGAEPEIAVHDALQEFLKVFTPDELGNVFSTLRSRRYAPGQEIQTVYAIAPDGTVQAKTRSMEAQTTKPVEPLSLREKVKLGLTGLGIAGGILAISSFFIDYPSLWAKVKTEVRMPALEELVVESKVFDDFIDVEKKAFDRGHRFLVLEMKTKDSPPEPDSMQQRMAAEALFRGYIRCEYFSKDDRFIGYEFVRAKGITSEPKLVLVPLPRQPKTHRVVLTY